MSKTTQFFAACILGLAACVAGCTQPHAESPVAVVQYKQSYQAQQDSAERSSKALTKIVELLEKLSHEFLPEDPSDEPTPEPTPADGLHVNITSEKATYAPGETVELRADGSAKGWAWWSASPHKVYEDAKVCVFSTAVPGDYVFVLAGFSDTHPVPLIAAHTVHIEGVQPIQPKPPEPVKPDSPAPITTKVTQVTYVYEKTQHYIPREVSAALSKLNTEQKILASPVEQDVKNGLNNVPAQYRIAVTTAQAHGLPCLIVQAGDAVVKVVKDPKTEAQVLEAVK